MMAGPGREFAVTHRPQFPAQSLLRNDDAELLEDRLTQFRQSPPDNTLEHWWNWRRRLENTIGVVHPEYGDVIE